MALAVLILIPVGIVDVDLVQEGDHDLRRARAAGARVACASAGASSAPTSGAISPSP